MLKELSPEVLDRLKSAAYCVVSTGAGISAESGVPTFRDAQTGFWAKYDPMELASPDGFRRNPQRVWEWYAYRRDLVSKTKPNPGHYAIARLPDLFEKFVLITQNVDGFHHLAGNPTVLELHGNIQRIKCSRDGEIIESWPETDEVPPRCPHCGAYLRPDVVWFGESLDPVILDTAAEVSENCDLFISVGTSGVVYPAAMLPVTAKHNGALVLEFNLEPTPISTVANHTFLGKSGELLPAFFDELKQWRG